MVAAVADNSLEDAYRALERAEEQTQRRLLDIQSQKSQLQRLMGVEPSARATVSLEYQGLGPVEAAERYLRLAGKALTTREVVDGMTERGWTTRSRNPVATVYAVLANAKKKFQRTGDSQWELVAKKKG